MAVRLTDPEALHLYQLIGAPLLAVIQAEAQAAQVSADFISRIGFDRAEPVAALPAAPPPAAAPPAAPDASRPPGEATEKPAATPPSDATPLQAGGDLGPYAALIEEL